MNRGQVGSGLILTRFDVVIRSERFLLNVNGWCQVETFETPALTIKLVAIKTVYASSVHSIETP